MTQRRIRIPIAVVASALALAGVVACGGESPPPQTPADQTTTTGASTAGQPYGTPAVTPSPAGEVAPAQAATPPMGTAPSTSMTSTTTGATTATSDVTLGDAQIIAVVEAANRGEIEQGREADHKGKSARVRQFASRMVKDHSAADTTLASVGGKAGISPQTSATAQQIASNGAQIMSSLRVTSGESFDKAYIDAQVEEHTEVLRLLDDQLIPHAQNSDLRKTLQDVRSKVADHLKMAQDIQSSLGKK